MSGPFLSYIPRIAQYYQTLGYGEPYRWHIHDKVHFSAFNGLLVEKTVAIVTTSALVRDGVGDQGPRAAYNGAAKFFKPYRMPHEPEPALSVAHIAYDRSHSPATDQQAWFPSKALKRSEDEGTIFKRAANFYGLPTNRSIRATKEDGIEIISMLREDQVDAVLLIPNCPVCHQSCSIVANMIEEAGIPTVVMGCAKDIVEHIGVPRFLFSNHPLGNGAGKPHDELAQMTTLREALGLLESAKQPRTTVHSQSLWANDFSWQDDYSNARKLSDEEIQRRRLEFDRQKANAHAVKNN